MAAPAHKILVINPNTTTHMTEALKPIVQRLNYTDVQFDYFTAPSTESTTLPNGHIVHGIPSINSGEDSAKSALHVKPFLVHLVPEYDGFLVACYSAHPLVGMLKDEIEKYEDAAPSSASTIASRPRRKYVTGIFEASVTASFSLISSFRPLNDGGLSKAQAETSFGIVSTGSVWKAELSQAVSDMLVGPCQKDGRSLRFAGVETTGLTAVELHETPEEEVRRRIIDATERLIKDAPHFVSAICMGCAGMAGMEESVREGCVRAYGERHGSRVSIVDGVSAGVGILVAACKAGF